MSIHGKLGSAGEEGRRAMIDAMCVAHGLPTPEYEVVFAPPRKWRLDLLFDHWLAVEIQGGLFVDGRHVQGAALLREYEKLNEAAAQGYSVCFVTPDQMNDGSAYPLIARILQMPNLCVALPNVPIRANDNGEV